MPLIIKGKKRHHVRFVSSAESSTAESAASTQLSRDRTRSRPASHPRSNPDTRKTAAALTMAASPLIPPVFRAPPPIAETFVTATLTAQTEVMADCLSYLRGSSSSSSSSSSAGLRYNAHGVPRLERARHAKFVQRFLGPLPGGYAAADAARPWFFYWCLNALSLLSDDEVVAGFRAGVVSSARAIQNPTGGFAGGHGQMSHVATSYAVVLALAIVGGEEAFEVIDRRAMWEWLCVLKQKDGGFQVTVGGEEDIRGAYCASVIISLLNLPLELSRESPGWTKEGDTLLRGLPEYVSRCQTFEGGISGCPDAEAHGAYAFCALGCLGVLGDPSVMIPRYLDLPRLISWLSSRQYGPEGGFSGRTNKLVDGCYSHWVGGCWPILENCRDVGPSSLYSREGLIRYILCCCQDLKKGGLRDKPGKGADSYHTCYVLAGLSSAQHQWRFDPPQESPPVSSDGPFNLAAAYSWTSSPYVDEPRVFDDDDLVNPSHPIFAIPEERAAAMRAYFMAKHDSV